MSTVVNIAPIGAWRPRRPKGRIAALDGGLAAKEDRGRRVIETVIVIRATRNIFAALHGPAATNGASWRPPNICSWVVGSRAKGARLWPGATKNQTVLEFRVFRVPEPQTMVARGICSPIGKTASHSGGDSGAR